MSIIARLAFLFVAVPLLELFILIRLGTAIGLLPTLTLCVVTGVAGAWLARREGLRALWSFQARLAKGGLPGRSLMDGLCILVGGALLLTPGLLTDVFGFSLLLPPSRRWIQQRMQRRIERGLADGSISGNQPRSASRRRRGVGMGIRAQWPAPGTRCAALVRHRERSSNKRETTIDDPGHRLSGETAQRGRPVGLRGRAGAGLAAGGRGLRRPGVDGCDRQFLRLRESRRQAAGDDGRACRRNRPPGHAHRQGWVPVLRRHRRMGPAGAGGPARSHPRSRRRGAGGHWQETDPSHAGRGPDQGEQDPGSMDRRGGRGP